MDAREWNELAEKLQASAGRKAPSQRDDRRCQLIALPPNDGTTLSDLFQYVYQPLQNGGLQRAFNQHDDCGHQSLWKVPEPAGDDRGPDREYLSGLMLSCMAGACRLSRSMARGGLFAACGNSPSRKSIPSPMATTCC